MGLRLITAPTDYALSLSEMKAHLRVDTTDDDALITRYLVDATEFLEQRLERKLMTQTWELIIDTFPDAEILLPFPPVQSITSVSYYDTAGNPATVASSDYFLDNTSRDPWLFPEAASPWPSTLDAVNSVTIRFVAGYATAAAVPGSIKAALVLKVRELYDEVNSDQAIDRLLQPYMRQAA
jgi:uncharacterized phiE125 gp8 family phage protein